MCKITWTSLCLRRGGLTWHQCIELAMGALILDGWETVKLASTNYSHHNKDLKIGQM